MDFPDSNILHSALQKYCNELGYTNKQYFKVRLSNDFSKLALGKLKTIHNVIDIIRNFVETSVCDIYMWFNDSAKYIFLSLEFFVNYFSDSTSNIFLVFITFRAWISNSFIFFYLVLNPIWYKEIDFRKLLLQILRVVYFYALMNPFNEPHF